jgi:hypothetical protein
MEITADPAIDIATGGATCGSNFGKKEKKISFEQQSENDF